jgi:hypothetical protein
MTEIQNAKRLYYVKKGFPAYVWGIGYWNLRFVCNVVLGIWVFRFSLSSLI